MIGSVSVFESYQKTAYFIGKPAEAAGQLPNSFYLLRSFLHTVVALGGMFATSLIPYPSGKARRSLLGTVLLFIPCLGIGNDYGTPEAGSSCRSFRFSHRNCSN